MDHDFVRFQAEHHPLVQTNGFQSLEEYCLHLMHRKAYEEAALLSRRKRVVDLGCNNGWGTRIIAREAASAVGVDVSEGALAEARRPPIPKNVEFYKVEGDHLPFRDGAFDMVVSCQVIEHVPTYATYLGEVRRVLNEDGVAVFTTPNACIRLDPGMKPWFPFHVREFSASELSTLLEEWFERVEVRGLFATRELYEIEFQRVQRSRERARRSAKAWLPPYIEMKAKVIDAVKALLPDCMENAARRLVRNWVERFMLAGTPSLDPVSFHRFSLADLHYRSERLEDSLDLMAVCHK